MSEKEINNIIIDLGTTGYIPEIVKHEAIKTIEMLEKEIDRLNNKINELEKYIEIQLSQGGERETRDLVDGYDILDKIKELKENK